jgi:putative heme-binding domain-containing protein
MRIIAFLLTAGAALAQHSYTPGDVQDGERLFLAACAVCHGPDGNMVPGTDLARGTYRRASTDDALGKIIRAGIPGTAMPPHTFSDFQVTTLVAFLRSLPAAAQSKSALGDLAKGKALFEGKGNCRNCHRTGDSGSRLGPDLTDIGARRRAVEIQQSILEPDVEIAPQNRFIRIVAKDGAVTTGRLLNQDAFTLQFMDPQERLRSVQKSNLKAFSFVERSSMPSYRDKLNPAELADIVSYLVSLKGVTK